MNRTPAVCSLMFVLVIGAFSTQIVADFDTSNVRVNQIGYLPKADKVATIISSSTSGISWQLRKASDNATVASGTTTVFGNDAASGDHVHRADFSSVTAGGTYYLWVNGVGQSVAFRIGTALYLDLPAEAMNYFYFHRMGVDIQAAYLPNAVFAHTALHPGDSSRACYQAWCGSSTRLNVRYSWADAGDFGIYPVNHAISAWTLLNLFERYPTMFPNGSLDVPESANGIPDILDEVQFGSTFMKGMLPPSGLASHKVHNTNWSAFPVTDISAENAQERYAQRPSTNATYAISRNLAHLARLLAPYNSAEASALWSIAETAWSRAEANPNVDYTGSTVDTAGGGDYGDTGNSDDRYAAAVELYLTARVLGDGTVTTYRNAVTSSTHYRTVGTFGWAGVAPTGTLSLLSAATDLPAADITTMNSNVLANVDGILTTMSNEGYSVPLSGTYPWGSNSFIVNRMILMAYAYDISGDVKYLKAMHRSMDYLMGNNAKKISYVTGYGEFHETDTHDRWAWGKYQSGTPYPKGWLSGGPMNESANCDNATPFLTAAKSYAAKDTAPGAWCSKENTINWNAPLVWVAAYLNTKEADLDVEPAPPPPAGTLTLDDFESGNASKWSTFKNSASTITTSIVSPGATGNYAMKVDYTVSSGGWAGVQQSFSPPQDWRPFVAFDFWFYGTASGHTIRLELLDNRAAGSTSDTAERFEYRISNDFSGWRKFSLPWSAFTRRTDWQPTGAPNDGLTLSEMWGFNFAPLSGSGSFRLDQVELVPPLVFDDFESGNTNKWGTFAGGGSSITKSTVSPGAVGSYAMKVDYTIASGGWGGVEQAFSSGQSWTAYNQFDFWLYGTNTGTTIRLEILDNRASGSTTDTSERFEHKITNDFSGWRRFTVPWSAFTRRTDWQPTGAPNDGLTLTGVWGFNFAPVSGSGSFRVDQVQLIK